MSAGTSTWSPFSHAVFRAVWIAALVSNLGSWMHLVAAAWLMTTLTTSAALVALLTTASAAPAFALALPAGAMADIVDRRRMIVGTQAAQLLVAAVLGVLTIAHATTPGLLLLLTLLLGIGFTLGFPAYAAITPELVPREELPAAISLNAIALTATQAVGPALGGLLVAALGPGAVFLLNAASFLAVVVVIAAWRRQRPVATLPPEHMTSAIRTGLRYTANAPELQTVLVRTAAHVMAYSGLLSLLAVLTRVQFGGSALDYGVLVGLLGVGGILGAVLLPRLRRSLRTDRLAVAAALLVGVGIALLSTARSALLAAPLMLVLGFANMAVLSSLNIAAQQVLPAWVRGRGLAIYQVTFQLTFALGAAIWGAAATRYGIAPTLIAIGVVMALSALLALRFRLDAADRVDVSPAYRTEPHVDVEFDPADGPVMVTIEYELPPERQGEFAAAARRLRQARRREGAMHWALYQDVERPDVQVESYVVVSWTEHRRQGERRTVTDNEAIDRAAALHAGAGPPRGRYLLGHHFRFRNGAPPRLAKESSGRSANGVVL